MHNAIYNLVLCVLDSRQTFTTLEKEHLIINYSWDMVQQKCLICLQSLVVYEKGGVMRGTQHFPQQTSAVYCVTVISNKYGW